MHEALRRRMPGQGSGPKAFVFRLLGLILAVALAVAGLLIVLVALAAALVVAPVIMLVMAIRRRFAGERRPRRVEIIEVDYERHD